MQLWYKDNELEIYFGDTPKVSIRYILPTSTKTEKLSIKKYPFKNKRDLQVLVIDKVNGVTYTFTIVKGYCWDGATILKLFWRIIGSNTDNTFIIMSMIHDFCCENHSIIGNNRLLSSKILRGLALTGGVPQWKAQIMYVMVDLFQRFKHWN